MKIKYIIQKIHIEMLRDKFINFKEMISSKMKKDILSFFIMISYYLLGISAIICIISLAYSLKGNELPVHEGISLDSSGLQDDHARIEEYSYYVDPIKNKRLFKAAKKKKPMPRMRRPVQKKAKPKPVTIFDLVKNLTLVGILGNGDMQAVIEDRRQRKTYYLKAGEMINEIKIEQIFEDKVILKYKNETTELRL